MSEPVIDREWFLDNLAKANRSVRGLARHLEIDASAVSRTFSGGRKMKRDEAEKIARFISQPLDEVLRRAGMPITVETNATMMLAATIGESGELTDLEAPYDLPASIVVRAQAAMTLGQTGRVIAAQVRASKGALTIWDDAVVLFVDSGVVEPSAVGVLSVARLRDGMQMLAHVEKARKTGEATVKLPNGELKEVSLVSATPVLAVIP